VVASLNGQIAELRAEAAVSLQASEDQASELTKARAVLLQHESYKEELESRIAKLSQRNDSSEAYIRDLETKCREYTENDDRKSEEITTLTQEIQVLKTEVTKSNTYITELEQRVSTSDSSSRDLTAAVDHHTTQAEARDKQIAELENKITMLTNEHAASNEENVTLLLEQIESRDRQIEALEARIQQSEQLTHEPKALTPTLAPSTPPDTPPVLRTIVEDADPLAAADVEEATPATEAPQVPSEVDRLRQENLDLMNRLREYELSYEQLRETPTTPTLDPPDEELEDEEDKQSKRGSTGESSESDTTLETPRLASRTVSPLEYSVRQRSEPRLLRPLSLSQGFSSYAYNPSSPRYSWSAPSNGIYERSPRQSPKRQSIPFDSKPLRSVQSLEIDLALLQKAVTDRDAQLQQREVEIKYLKKKLENSASPSTTQINADEVIERLRKDHSDQVDKIRDEHQRGMNALDNEYHSSVGALRNQLEQLKATQADELHFAKESHKTDLTELQNRHAKEIATEMTTSKDMKTALEAAWAELSATGARHQAERDSLISVHHAEIAEMEKRHASVIASLQAELNSSSTQLQTLSGQLTAITEAREQAEQELAAREDDLALREQELSVRSTDNVPMEEHNIVVSAMEEMEAALTAAEDEKRQLKNKAQLEHSKLRDEHDLELMSLRNKISDLEKQLLESRNRDSRATDRSSRTKLPPIGPPPTAPLPPVPAGREAVLSPTPTSRGDESPRSSASHDRPASSEDPDRLLQLESQIDKFKADLSKKETDFMELRKSNSKLKVRVDDTNRENTDLKRERDNLRRDVVQMKNDLADQEYERIADRQRLEGAKLEAQQYKAKLDRMVDAKVTKRSDQKLKCF
jgi:kinesin family protein 4/21/27